MANVNVTSDVWTEISITSGTIQNISATADIELSAEQTDNSGVVLKPSELYQWDNETIYARAVTEETGALRVVNFKRATGGGSSVAYSTTEQQIGTWIDGKPLYQKTLTGTIAQATAYGEEAWTRVDLTALNISQMVNMEGVLNQVYNGSYTMQMVGRISATALSASKNVDCVSISYDGANKELDIINSAQWANDSPYYATIRYTKTTD